MVYAPSSSVGLGRIKVIRMTYSVISNDKRGLWDGCATDGSNISSCYAPSDTDYSCPQWRNKSIALKTDLQHCAAQNAFQGTGRTDFWAANRSVSIIA